MSFRVSSFDHWGIKINWQFFHKWYIWRITLIQDKYHLGNRKKSAMQKQNTGININKHSITDEQVSELIYEAKI